MDFFDVNDPVIVFSYTRPLGSTLQTGLSLTVTVTNAKTNATLLAATAMSESAAGSGVYQYSWTHGLTQDTQCLVTYTIGGSRKVFEQIEITTITQTGGHVG